jgi:uncharacterized protein (TIGR03437 family)
MPGVFPSGLPTCGGFLTLKKLNSLLSLALFLAAAAGLRAQSITVDKTALSLSAQTGGAAAQATINVSSSTGAGILFVVQSNTSWLKCNPCTGTTPSAVTVTADPTGLQVGSYTGALNVSGGSGNPVAVTVTFGVGAISASPSSVSFAFTMGGTVPGPANIQLTGQAVSYTATATSTGNWLQVSPASGSAPGLLMAQLNSAIVPTLAAGPYNGSITITPSSGPAISIPVTLTVSPQPPVTVSATTVALAFQLSGANNNPSQTVTLSTTASQALGFGVTSSVTANPSGGNWIVVNPMSGQIPAGGSTQLTISYNTTTVLPAGTYTGTVNVQVAGALFPNGTSQQSINVTLLVSPSSTPLLMVPSSTLSFIYELGGSVPAAKTFTPCSTATACNAASGQSAVTVSAATATGGNWLTVTPPTTATTGQAFSVSVNPTGLTVGTYNGTITVNMAGGGNNPQTIPVQLTVANDPLLQTNVSSISLPFQLGQAAAAPFQVVSVTSSTGAPLNYTATASSSECGGAWLALSGATTGSTPNTFAATINTTGLAAGTCHGAISISATLPATGAAAVNSPLSIPVVLTVSANPLLTVTLPGNPPAPPVFTAQQGGSSPGPQSIVLGSTTPSTTLNYSMTFTTASGGNWLQASPVSGTTATTGGSNTIIVSAINTGLLSAGTYTGTITITATNPGGPNSGQVDNATATNPVVIPVTFQITTGTLSVSPNTLTFTQTSGGSAPAAQSVNVTSTPGALNYTVAVNSNSSVSWLSATPLSGTTPGQISVSVDGSKLSAGTYTGTVTVTAPGAAGSPAPIQVTFTVTPGTISAPTTALNFTQVAGGPAPAAQPVAVTGTAGLSFTVTPTVTTPSGGTWLTATVGSGTSATGTIPANVQVSVNAGSLTPGTYTGNVKIDSPGATGTPINVPVNLTVVAPATLTVTPATLNFSYTIGAQTPPAPQNVSLTASASVAFTAAVTTSDGGKWLTVSPASGTASTSPIAISVGINTAAVPTAGTYTGTITFSSSSALTPATVTVNLQVVTVPTPTITAIQNAGSYTTGVPPGVAPGENIVLYGTGIGPSQIANLIVNNGSVATTVANTQVLFDNTPAPIIYAGANGGTQTSVMVPFEVAGRPTTQITVVFQGVRSAPLTYNVTTASPGIYTQNSQGTGPGSILNQDYSVNGPTKPAAQGSVVQVYLTGTGQTTPPAVTGLVNTTLKNSLLTYTATIGGLPAQVVYQGTAPGLVEGVMQFNIVVPANAPSGPQQIVITNTTGTATYSSQAGVTVQVQ